jgi:hypothetical protein
MWELTYFPTTVIPTFTLHLRPSMRYEKEARAYQCVYETRTFRRLLFAKGGSPNWELL